MQDLEELEGKVPEEHQGRKDQVLLVGDSKPRRVVKYSHAGAAP